MRSALSIILLIVCCSYVELTHAHAADAPDYGRDVRPILSQFCFKCHGPDDGQRQAGLRLHTREGATAKSESGKTPISPKQPHLSELVRRIESTDPDEVMPPASTKRVLTAAQKETLKNWIASGAEYKPHWSFVVPVRPSTPGVQRREWPRGGIDSFVLARLETEKLAPSPEADKYTLVRRAALDLIGLPPTPEEADEFVNDASPDAYERLLDRLLASPRYGERWARRWLDLARYADTNGYEKDRQRSVWPYRDWVINALNANLPFDRFTVEQLAGDMLPGATLDQRIATGFHRNTMLNEEGGIDPLEFRYHAMTDRVATTATTWLGLTVGCAQCHTHKYDPITHRDYFSFFALLNNADEPEMDVVRSDITARRASLLEQIAAHEADLPNRFPLPDDFEWTPIKPVVARSTGMATLEIKDDASVFVTGTSPDKDTYLVGLDSDLTDVVAVRLEALADPALPSKGPGRTPHGNFVLTEFKATLKERGAAASGDAKDDAQPLKFVRASADFSQESFSPEQAIDGNVKTGGWAIHGPGEWNVNRTATFFLAEPGGLAGKTARWTIRLDQNHGMQHTLGKFRISLGRRPANSNHPEAARRLAHREQKFGAWLAKEEARVVKWTTLKPVAAKSNLALLTIQDDDSIFASGDMSKRDLYDISYVVAGGSPATGSATRSGEPPEPRKWTALRIEAVPDERLPKNGPGRVYYEGPFGDFFLSTITVAADGQPVKLTGATQSFANGGNTAAMALDENQQTGWSINGGQGKPHVAVFRFATPVAKSARFDVSMLFERYYAASLGRFKVSVTDDPRPAEASSLPAELATDLLIPRESRSPAQVDRLLQHFAGEAPELAGERAKIAALRAQLPAFPTTLILQERPANNPRATHRHHRGEFLQPKELVEPAVLAALPQLDAKTQSNRLALAEWLVGPTNPLTARVTANRQWSAFFGRGLVKSLEDFGSQGASPTHPELLDWLAVEFGGGKAEGGMKTNASVTGSSSFPSSALRTPPSWDIKRLHRLIVSSATYRQSSRVTRELLVKDAANELLARGARLRVEAEVVRDAMLAVSGLLSDKQLGPSVFPAQPANITTEGTYGGLNWALSPGEDRYRRTLYTFTKRTAPFALSMTFDGPSGEACVARREVSNTPLQALTLLNDTVFIETAQALGREFAERSGSVDERLHALFRRALTRPPTDDELALLKRFFDEQSSRLDRKELDAAKLAGAGDPNEAPRAAWTLVARAIMNLDEAVTKN
ncbi:MAG: PSD1 and planctomycete cytochrome C domain-containing protein [Planctomycetota bacterium]